MPIRPENRRRYPPDWPQISQRIRTRDGNRCKWCGVANHALGGRLNGDWLPAIPEEGLHGLIWPEPGTHATCGDGARRARLRIIRVVITVAHLNHTPEDCRDENLAALCQRCHLNYDRHIHVRNLRATIRKRYAMRDLFCEAA